MQNQKWMFVWFALSSVVCMVGGCSRNEMPKATIEEKQTLYNDAMTKMAAKDYAGAKENATRALKGGGLNADQASELTLVLIETCLRTGDLDTAGKEIEAAKSTVVDVAKYLVLKSFYLAKKGDIAGSQDAMSEARQLDSNVEIPDL